MLGQAHDQAGILIEPKAEYAINIGDEDQLIKLRNLLWLVNLVQHFFYRLNTSFCRTTIDGVNKVAPSFSTIFKEMILVTHKDKLLPRAVKGTLTRSAALMRIKTLWEFFLCVLQQSTNLNVIKDASVEMDIFEQGFDR